MALQDNIATVNISLLTGAISQAGFSTILFISNDQRFPERVRAYTSTDGGADDFATTDKAYIALQTGFSADPAPSVIKVGRTASHLTTANLTPAAAAENEVYSVTVYVNDGFSVTATYTALAGDDEEAILTSIASTINGDANVGARVTATVVGTGSSATLDIVANTADDIYYLSDEQNFTIGYTTTEAPADTLQAIIDEDDDFYFVTAFDHTQSYILGMAATVEAMDRIYVTSVSDADSYETLTDPATDTLGLLKAGNYLRTAGMYHQSADTLWPEMRLVAVGAVYTPGTITWANKPVTGLDVSRNSSGNKLTYTQRNNLNDRSANWIEYQGGVAVVRGGTTAYGENIDVVRSMDYWKARLVEGLQTKLIYTPKIPVTDTGINEIRSTCHTVSNRLVTTPGNPNVLQENNPYQFNFPRASEISAADKQAGILRGTFVGYLAGAIKLVEVTGTLTYEGLV